SYLLVSDESLAAVSGDGVWMAWNLIGRPGAGLFETTKERLPAIRKALLDEPATVCDLDAFDVLRIEAGLPLFGVDFSDANLPQEVGRDDVAISFKKGCYLGQETVARIDALGHVNQRICGVNSAGQTVPERGIELTRDGVGVGHVTSAAFSPRLQA